MWGFLILFFVFCLIVIVLWCRSFVIFFFFLRDKIVFYSSLWEVRGSFNIVFVEVILLRWWVGE